MSVDDFEEGQDSSSTVKDNASLEHYAPVLRDGPYERSVMASFGGLPRFTRESDLGILPVIELTNEDDLTNLDPYRQAGIEVLVDAPEYLIETAEPNGHTEDVQKLLDGSGPVEFLNNHSDRVDVPVVSGTMQRPLDYTELRSRYLRLSNDFDRAAIRVFIPTSSLTSAQLEQLRTVQEEISNEDRVLLDYLHQGSLNPNDPGRENLHKAAAVFEDNPRTILDAFNVYEGENYNFGPDIAREIDVAGFGDYAVDRRFPDETPPPVGMHDTRNIRHYDFQAREVKKFQGKGYTGGDSAYEDLEDWSKWDDEHCEFCKEAATTDSEGMGTWKKIRMGHYIDAVIEEEA